MIYASNPSDIQIAINIVKRLEGGLILTIQYQNTYSLKEKMIQLTEQLIVMQEQPAKVPIYQLL